MEDEIRSAGRRFCGRRTGDGTGDRLRRERAAGADREVPPGGRLRASRSPRASPVFPEGSKGADYVAAYRTWLGIEPYPQVSLTKKPKATEDDLDMSKKVELVALAVKGNAVSCRILGKDHVLTLRPAGRLGGSAGGDHHRHAAQEVALCAAIPTWPARSRPGASTYPLSALRP